MWPGVTRLTSLWLELSLHYGFLNVGVHLFSRYPKRTCIARDKYTGRNSQKVRGGGGGGGGRGVAWGVGAGPPGGFCFLNFFF